MQKWFTQTNAMMRKLREGSLFSLDRAIVEKELEDYFNNCGLNPYIKRDLKKIERNLRRKSKLHIIFVRHNDDAVPYEKRTTVGYSTRYWYDPGFKEYTHCWG